MISIVVFKLQVFEFVVVHTWTPNVIFGGGGWLS